MSTTTDSSPQATQTRIARALQIRIDAIRAEKRECERLRQQAYQFADECADDLDELDEVEALLERELWQLTARLDRKNRRQEVVACETI